MRKRFEAQMTLGCTPIDQVEIPTKTRASMAALVAALQYIYTHREWNQRIFDLLLEKGDGWQEKTGRRGMSLWEIFVLGQFVFA
jgi:transposase, IS5 family